jgi:purine-nucleoside phosphorylase
MREEFYDDKTEPIIELKQFYGEQKHLVDKCLIIFSKVIHDHILEKFDCVEIGSLGACNGRIPIYCLEYKGEKIAFYLTGIGSAFASGACYEAHWVIGATKFIMFGSCGSLDPEQTTGRFIIPTESYRGEGDSTNQVESLSIILQGSRTSPCRMSSLCSIFEIRPSADL